jgi:type IV secretion system protein VirB10
MKIPLIKLWTLGAALMVFDGLALGQTNDQSIGGHSASENSKVTVPANTTIPVVLKNTISSRTAAVGQAIYCETIYPITVGNRIVIPVGSYVKGSVTQVIRPGHVKGKGQIGLRFESITLASGTTRPLRATLSGFAGNGKEGFNPKESKIEGESSKGQDAGRVAETTITGAEIGTIAGAADHSIGKGLGIGSAAGAAGGLIWILASRGKEIVLPSGTSLELQLSTPLTFENDEIDPPSAYQNGPALPRRNHAPGI